MFWVKGCYGYLRDVVMLWYLRDVVMLWVFKGVLLCNGLFVFKGCGYVMGI